MQDNRVCPYKQVAWGQAIPQKTSHRKQTIQRHNKSFRLMKQIYSLVLLWLGVCSVFAMPHHTVENEIADAYTLVTNADDLQEGDKVIIGVADGKTNYIMGLFDETVSRNNIHAIRATYASDRSTVGEKEEAIYTIGTVEKDGKQYLTFMDGTGYYLVASGGNPNKGNNNYLTVWDKVDSPNYGLYGGWTVSISATGEATLQNMGTSRSKLLQYNPNGTTPIFACYPEPSQTPVAIYKYTHIDPTLPYIQSGTVNFGTILLGEDNPTGERTIDIQATHLSENIQARLSQGGTFTISTTELDKDGGSLRIAYTVETTGEYVDTLWLTSGDTQARYTLWLRVSKRMTIAEVRQQDPQTVCFLQPVVVTKKYNKHIFVEDTTGALLLYDGGNQYGKDLKNGYVLSRVTGKYNDYYNNPSLNLTDKFSSKKGEVYLPTLQTEALTIADVCRYVRMENVRFDSEGNLLFGGNVYPLYDLFGVPQRTSTDMSYDLEGIVYFYNEIVLCPTAIQQLPTAVSSPSLQGMAYRSGMLENPQGLDLRIYTAAGVPVYAGNGDVDMQAYPQGMYIICHKEGSIRVVR